MDSWSNSLKKAALVAVAVLAVLAPTASAATVVNGDFETGSLSGWFQYNQNSNGEWDFYDKAEAEAEGFFPPPSGNFAAVTIQGGPDLHILYQDIALEPAFTHQLALTLYYQSSEPIFVDPTTLSAAFPSNQHVRVDVIKPTAPIDSINPGDILATVFANKNGDPEVMAPTPLRADLSSLAGQTVRLRIANSVTKGPFNAGLDAVSITSAPVPLPPVPPSNAISRGKLTLNKKKGTAKLAINVPGPGTLTAVAKGKKKKVRKAALTVTAAGTVKVPLSPNGAGKKVLNEEGKLKAQIAVTFTPTGGTANTQTYKVTLKKTLPKN